MNAGIAILAPMMSASNNNPTNAGIEIVIINNV